MNEKEPVLKSKRTQVTIGGVFTAWLPVLNQYFATGAIEQGTIEASVYATIALIMSWVFSRGQRNTAS